MSDGTVTVERRGAIALVTLDRPARKNAMSQSMWAALGRAAETLHAEVPRAVVLTGAAGAFSAGMDVNPDNPHVAGLIDAVQRKDAGPVRAMLEEMLGVLDRLFALPVPIIAAVGGVAYGGGAELATRCDLRVVAPSATFCFSEVKLGLMPDWGGGVALARLLGPARAADLILTARKVGADEALALGLANRVGGLDDALALAGQIAENGPRAVRAALSVIRGAGDLSWRDALALELDAASDLIAAGECQVGIAAFLSRTSPRFVDP
jgi:enoyl-CoA hydratase